jgi:YVTN family beta-propeller protein
MIAFYKRRTGFLTTVILSFGLGLCSVVPAAPLAFAAPTAYVTNAQNNTVLAIDTATKTVVATVPVGSVPVGVAVTPDGAFAYVANLLSAAVSVIDTATNTVVNAVGVGNEPSELAITPDGAFVYVTNLGSGTVSVIATATNTVVATIPVGSGPLGVAITPDGAFAYVANISGNTVSVIATATNTVVSTISGLIGPYLVAITPDGALAYVTGSGSGSVSVIAVATNTLVASIPVENGPRGIAITPDGEFAYVTNEISKASPSNGSVSVISTATKTVVATIPVNGTNPFWAAFTPDGKFAYVPIEHSNATAVIATATKTVVGAIPVGGSNVGVAIQGNKPAPLRLSTDHGGNTGLVTLTVFGSGISAASTARLSCSAQPDIVGANTAVTPNGMALTTTVDLTRATPGQCAVVLTKLDGSTRTVPHLFTIEQGGTPQVWVDVIGWSFLRAGRSQTYFVIVGNRGNVDSSFGNVWVTLPSVLNAHADANQAELATFSDGTTDSLIYGLDPIAAGNTVVLMFQLTAQELPHRGFTIQSRFTFQ